MTADFTLYDIHLLMFLKSFEALHPARRALYMISISPLHGD